MPVKRFRPVKWSQRQNNFNWKNLFIGLCHRIRHHIINFVMMQCVSTDFLYNSQINIQTSGFLDKLFHKQNAYFVSMIRAVKVVEG